MKRIYTILILSLLPVGVFAQDTSDRFIDYTQMQGDEVIFYNASTMAEYQGFYAYEIIKDKPSLIKDKVVYKRFNGSVITVGDIVKYKKNEFLKVKLNGKDLYLILNEGFAYKENMRSLSYWKKMQEMYSERCHYVLTDSELLTGKFDDSETSVGFSKYFPVTWLPIEIPEKLTDDVVFCIEVKGPTNRQINLSLNDIIRYEGDFAHSSQYESEKAEYERVIAEAERVQAERDAAIDNSSVFEANVILTNEAKKKLNEKSIEYDFDSKLRFSVYGSSLTTSGAGNSGATSRVYKGFLLQKTIELPESAVSFINPTDKQYIDRRGNAGEVERKKTAEQNDLIYTQHYTDSLEKVRLALVQQIERTKTYYHKNTIFILAEDKLSSGSRLGVRFRFFNCYGKDIQDISLRVVTFNAAGERQGDDYGKYAEDLKCTKPIKSGESKIFNFESLFRNVDKAISEIRLVEVIVTFADGTKKTYTGKDQVDRIKLVNHNIPDIASFSASKALADASDFSSFIAPINWKWTENQFVNALGSKVVKDKHEEWDSENSESNYCFNDVTVCGIPLAMSYIRVNQDTKKLFRLNFIVLYDESDLSLYPKIDANLIKEFGQPDFKENGVRSTSMIWTFDDYIMEAQYSDISNVSTEEVERYYYSISIEPITTYYVNWKQAEVEHNEYNKSIPKIEYFRVDNDQNVYIKEVGKAVRKVEKNRTYDTPKGEIISYNGGMFCYRPVDNDVVHMEESLAVVYPVVVK